MNVIKEIAQINEKEIALGAAESGTGSWHHKYRNSAYIFVGGLNYKLTEGDLLAVFCQYGNILDINLVRDKDTGKSKGFAFMMYENQKSTVLAVDNFNGIKLCERVIRVDHCADYRTRNKKDITEMELLEKEEAEAKKRKALKIDPDSEEEEEEEEEEEGPIELTPEQRRNRADFKKAKAAYKAINDKGDDMTEDEKKERKKLKKELKKLQVERKQLAQGGDGEDESAGREKDKKKKKKKDKDSKRLWDKYKTDEEHPGHDDDRNGDHLREGRAKSDGRFDDDRNTSNDGRMDRGDDRRGGRAERDGPRSVRGDDTARVGRDGARNGARDGGRAADRPDESNGRRDDGRQRRYRSPSPGRDRGDHYRRRDRSASPGRDHYRRRDRSGSPGHDRGGYRRRRERSPSPGRDRSAGRRRSLSPHDDRKRRRK